MDDRKTHIKRTQEKTFCGIKWNKYRKSVFKKVWTYHEFVGRDYNYEKVYKFTKELPTAIYESADCMTCLASFKATVEGLVIYGNVDGLMSVISKMKNNAI